MSGTIGILDRYACQRCQRRDGLDGVVDDEVWARLSAAAGGVNILCLWCMDELAQQLGYEGPVRLYFAGRALHGDMDTLHAEAIDMAARAARRIALVEAANVVRATLQSEGLRNYIAQRIEDLIK